MKFKFIWLVVLACLVGLALFLMPTWQVIEGHFMLRFGYPDYWISSAEDPKEWGFVFYFPRWSFAIGIVSLAILTYVFRNNSIRRTTVHNKSQSGNI
ncbi:MAG TPA: hypothetical protein PKD64_03020 [Pirellulaceae bacterium]|nr:hypothetical protein [Pirellulaceae bacterium]HMO91141.1 hypothetical protein [Pirellulaceae bacterium]HMP69088.1 hypothetical protein [Pirellulaceae bacterium]